MSVIRTSETRRSQTPAATMTTLASPTLGAADRPIWRVEVAPGAPAGPRHIIDVEQIWVFTTGAADVDLAGQTHSMQAGDTVVVPANAERTITGDPITGFSAIVTAPAGGRAWTLPREGDGIIPPWTA
ncbi:Cupin 2 conserved barrel domain protein [Catenulispora acidiphila DSM 44928]|uniref:Cupin 2 conserved barrel domain protein n=1 Tax=Catenulispora acidiphila (strain DSM 44928 / JCM 14897 / NBRC 102108 / NRRL B-24433 / ID139908) TaxID=479433 RepID=C7QB36_CATAD|nr:cupin domain-containing protein [Catenulispora acidiphila]ACU76327.1 Cupin 2 conserved barrel domain protein [Catenulispora acidiphila DSM 44928]